MIIKQIMHGLVIFSLKNAKANNAVRIVVPPVKNGYSITAGIVLATVILQNVEPVIKAPANKERRRNNKTILELMGFWCSEISTLFPFWIVKAITNPNKANTAVKAAVTKRKSSESDDCALVAWILVIMEDTPLRIKANIQIIQNIGFVFVSEESFFDSKRELAIKEPINNTIPIIFQIVIASCRKIIPYKKGRNIPPIIRNIEKVPIFPYLNAIDDRMANPE